MSAGGRPRQFDEEAILGRILVLFRKNGYDNTTFDQLVAESGLSRSSLYNAFGGKKRLMEKAMKIYIESEADELNELLTNEDSGLEALQMLIGNYTKPVSRGSKDCLVRKTLLQNAGSSEPPIQVSSIKKSLTKLWRAITVAVGRARVDSRAGTKKPPVLTDEERAAIIVGLIQGTAVIGRTGNQSELLQKIQSGAEKLLS